MKHIFLILSFFFLFLSDGFAKDIPNSIVVYEIPSYQKSKGEIFFNKITSYKKAMYKAYNNTYIIIVLSKGYNIETYEYLLNHKFIKKVFTNKSADYFKWQTTLNQKAK